MATCNAETLLSNGACLQSLDREKLRLVIIGTLVEWASANDPDLDVTPEEIMSRACENDLHAMSHTQLLTVIYSLLCNISGG